MFKNNIIAPFSFDYRYKKYYINFIEIENIIEKDEIVRLSKDVDVDFVYVYSKNENLDLTFDSYIKNNLELQQKIILWYVNTFDGLYNIVLKMYDEDISHEIIIEDRMKKLKRILK